MSSASNNATWAVHLEGNPVDLEWAEATSANLGISVSRGDDGIWLLTSTTFVGLGEAALVRDEATQVLLVVNGAGAVHDPGFRPLIVGHVYRFHPDGGKDAFVLIRSAVEINSAILLTGGTPVDPGPSVLEMADAAAKADPDLALALSLYGVVPRTFSSLYKVFELSEQHPDHKNWTSGKERRRFKHTANSIKAAGDQARHAVEKTKPPKNPMTLTDASVLVRTILHRWIREVWSSLP